VSRGQWERLRDLALYINALAVDAIGLQEIDGADALEMVASFLHSWPLDACPNMKLGHAADSMRDMCPSVMGPYSSEHAGDRWEVASASVGKSAGTAGMTVGFLSRLPIDGLPWQSGERAAAPLGGSACGHWLSPEDRETVAAIPARWPSLRANMVATLTAASATNESVHSQAPEPLHRHLIIRVRIRTRPRTSDTIPLLLAVTHLKAFPHDTMACARREAQALVLRRAIERACHEYPDLHLRVKPRSSNATHMIERDAFRIGARSASSSISSCRVVVLGDMNDFDHDIRIQASSDSESWRWPTPHQRLLHLSSPSVAQASRLGMPSAGRPSRDRLSPPVLAALDAWGSVPSSRALGILRLGARDVPDASELPVEIPS